MASRTQLRLGQITGSFGTGAINDQIAAAATGSIATTDLQGVLSHLAGAIKRIHGEDSFSQNAAGEFAVTLQPSSNDGGALGGISNNWSDLYLADGAVINLGNDQDVKLTHVADTGILLTGTGLNQLAFRDADLVISSSADGTLDIEADTQINLGTDRSGIAISIGHTTSEVTINDNLTVTGDLTVNGDTVTLDVTNKSLEDQLIILNSGSAANPTKQDVGIIFAQPDVSRVLYIDDSDSQKFVFATTYTSGTATGTNAVTKLANADVVMGALETSGVTNSALTDNRVVIAGTSGVLEDDANLTFDGTELAVGVNQFSVTASNGRAQAKSFSLDGDNTIELNGSDLTINAESNMLLNFAAAGKIAIMEANTERGSFQSVDPGAGETLVLSSSAGQGLALASNDDESRILLADNATDLGGNGFYLSLGTQDEIAFQNFDANPQSLLGIRGSFDHYFSGSLALSGTHDDAGAIRLLERSTNGENYVELNANISLSDNLTLTLPTSNGTNGQVLKINSGGGTNVMQLEFGDALGDLSKGVKIIAAQVSAGDAVNFNAVDAGDTISGLEQSDAQGKSLDVFVNGQLLVSGSESERAAGDRDYAISSGTELKFAFNLEIDDVVQLIKR